MKRALTFVFVLGFSCCLYAQAVDTTVCEILNHPQSFNGKIVRIKGTVVAGFDQFVVKGADCGINVNKNIWLSYPEGTKAKAGPAAMVQFQPARNFAGEVPVPCSGHRSRWTRTTRISSSSIRNSPRPTKRAECAWVATSSR
jgi:hypothetical protein